MVNDSRVHNDVLTMIQKLDAEDQLQLIEELAVILRNRVTKKKHSLLELKGLGKEIWKGMDAQEYVDRERGAWGG